MKLSLITIIYSFILSKYNFFYSTNFLSDRNVKGIIHASSPAIKKFLKFQLSIQYKEIDLLVFFFNLVSYQAKRISRSYKNTSWSQGKENATDGLPSVVTCQIVSYRSRNARIHNRRLIRGMEIRNRSEDAYHLLLSCRTQTQAASPASGLAGWLRHVKFTCDSKAMDGNEEGDFISPRNAAFKSHMKLLKSRVNSYKINKINKFNKYSLIL